jgi:carboxylesterase
MMSQIIPTAEPFFFPGAPDKPGVLLIHGFTGTPQSLRLMGEYLSLEHGFTCLGIRLAGHATSPEDMANTTYLDWIASVEDGFDLLLGIVDNIYLAGLSMGGALGLLLSTRLPARGVIAMATPFDLGYDWRLKITGILTLFQPYLPKRSTPPGGDWYDKQAWQEYVSYPCIPVRSVIQLRKLLDLMRTSLPSVTQPVLLMHSRQDEYPMKDSMSLIFDRLGTPNKEVLWLDGSGHVITLDAQRETVFRASADFINKVEKSQGAGISTSKSTPEQDIALMTPK